MPTIAIKYVVSFSSQDERHPVSNIVNDDGVKKWLSHPKEKSGLMEAVFQLDRPCVISYIDIGSIWCASLEIKAGCSEWPVGREFETLAYTVNLMTPADCMVNRNPNRTQMFSSDLFCSEVAKKEWDRIKVICRQPYKKHTQFGLSFIRVRTLASVPNQNVEKKIAVNGTTVKDIKNHFLGILDNRGDKSSDQLKSRLLKIAASSDNGVEHTEALSRTAKLVLAASGSKSKSYNTSSPVPESEKNRLYSSKMEQKYGPGFEEEVDDFLKNLVLDPTDLDNITLADVRHKFERKKRRKLTKEEKRIFIEKAKKHLTSAFRDRTNIIYDKENIHTSDSEKDKNVNSFDGNDKNTNNFNKNVNYSGENDKKVNHSWKNDKKVNQSSENDKKVNNFNKNVNHVSENDKKVNYSRVTDSKDVSEPKRQSVKRKLENDCITPPPNKVINKNHSPVTLIQKIKSAVNHVESTENHDVLNKLKNLKQNEPSCSKTSMPGTPHQYKGLRGRESDCEENVIGSPKFLSSAKQTPTSSGAKQSPKTNDKQTPKSSAKQRSTNGAKKVHTPADVSFLLSTDDEISSDDDLEFFIGNTRGKGRGRGRGRGRGKKSEEGGVMSSGKKTNTPRGRGRGNKRGARNTSFRSEIEDVDTYIRDNDTTGSTTSSITPSVPRGFTKCTGCGDFYGDPYLSAHQQKCSVLKSQQTAARSDKTSVNSTRSPARQVNTSSSLFQKGKKRSTASSLEIRPTGFVKCDGCNEYFGDNLTIHQLDCLPWKSKTKSGKSISDESPWRSAKPLDNSNLKSANQNSAKSKSGQIPKQNPSGSPPWLLAAEKRLKQQAGQGQMSSAASGSKITNTKDSKSSSNMRNTSNTSIDIYNPTSQIIASQQQALEQFQSNTEDSQYSQNQSILSSKNSNNRNSRSSIGKASNSRRSSGVSQSRFPTFEISDDSDDEDDDNNSNSVIFNGVTGIDSSSVVVNGAGSRRVVTDDDYFSGWIHDDADIVDDASSSSVGARTGACGSSAADNNNYDYISGWVQCPLCEVSYPASVIEPHAANCYL